MKKCYLLSLMALYSLCACNHSAPTTTEHKGERAISLHVADLDTIRITNPDMGARYKLALMDSSIMYADHQQRKLFFYNLSDGKLTSTRLGQGQGPNELISMMEVVPLRNSEDEIVIIDQDARFYLYYPSADSLSYRGRIDFDWGHEKKGDYNDPGNYTLMNMTDFALTFVKQDSDIIFPVEIFDSNFDETNKEERYVNGHFLSHLSLDSLKVHDLFGQFPEIYAEKPMPYFEFFDFVIDNDHIIYNFAPDPLIYIADLNGNPVETIGFEPEGVNREYTVGFDHDWKIFREDFKKVGSNTGLYLDNEVGLLFRTSIRDLNDGEVILQAYDRDGNLVLEEDMPPYFKMLGKRDGKYYGARFRPQEVDDDLIFPVYSFTVK